MSCAEAAFQRSVPSVPPWRWVLSCLAAMILLGRSPAAACTGDCNGDGEVTVDEILVGVNVALDRTALPTCPSLDGDQNGRVTVDELISAVRAALQGCPTPPTPTATPVPLPAFSDVTAAAGVEYLQYVLPRIAPISEAEYYSGGAAAGDYDGDGWVDLYVTRLDAPAILFHNQGDGTFEDRSEPVIGTLRRNWNGAAWGDIDNDGDLDLYVTALNDTRHYLFINDGAGHLTEQAELRNAAIPDPGGHYGFSVAFGDFDRDGYLDVAVGQWLFPVGSEPSKAGVRLLHNRGAAAPGYFDDVTSAAGLEAERTRPIPNHTGASFQFTPRFADLDDDGWPDLAMTADFGTSRLFWNNHDGTFLDGTLAAGVGSDENGMGATIGDYDGDGRLDWFVTSIFDPDNYCALLGLTCSWGRTGNRLYHNDGQRRFSDRTDAAGVRDGYWGWGTAFFDYDNDGDLDLTMTNGLRYGFAAPDDPNLLVISRFLNDPMRLWRNDGATMSEVSAASGMTSLESGKGLLTFDYDNDGDVDVFVVNNTGYPVLYRNNAQGNTWLSVKLIGTDTNRDAIGARVWVTAEAGGPSQLREIDGGSHYLAQSEFTAHFGLGAGTEPVAEVRVEWPKTGRVQRFENVARNTKLIVEEPAD